MFLLRIFVVLVFTGFLVIQSGCQRHQISTTNVCDPIDLMANQCGPSYLEAGHEPDLACEVYDDFDTGISPLDVSDYTRIHYQEMTLQECVRQALANSKVFRDLGGSILSAPRLTPGVFGPAITYTDPQFSEEAALSAFDANFSAAAFFQNNDQASNLTFQGNNGIFVQDFHDYRVQLQKLSANGSIFTLRNLTAYDNSNQTGQTLPHSWSTVFEGEVRQPLLQGAGVLFNRIAGPSQQAGVYGGVLIARTNTEISLSRFEAGVRDLISEVENAYWDLQFAYRNLEAVIEGRDKAYEILVATTEGKAREGSQAQAQAREQYLRFESDVLDAMEGKPTFGTRNNNGMAGGVFLSNGGVRVAERRLRLVCGLPINGNQLIRTSDEPATTGIQFDWNTSIQEAVENRQELRQQRWLIKQRELQVLAAKNFLKPRLDLVGQYRFRGLGRSLTADSNSFTEDLLGGTQTSSAFADLYSGDFQEWQVGAEFSMPIGFRQGHLAVRNAELSLSREQALLNEQKREVMFGLSNAFGEARRAFTSLQAAEEQYVAAREFQYVMQLEVERGRDRDIELEAQRRVVDAQISYRQAQIEYMLAIKNIHFEKGTYLDYCNIRLSESQSNPKAAQDAAFRAKQRIQPINYALDSPIIARAELRNSDCVESCNAPSTATNYQASPETVLETRAGLSVSNDSVLESVPDDSGINQPGNQGIPLPAAGISQPLDGPILIDNLDVENGSESSEFIVPADLEQTQHTRIEGNTINLNEIPSQSQLPDALEATTRMVNPFYEPEAPVASSVSPLPALPDTTVANNVAIPSFEPESKERIRLMSSQTRTRKTSRRKHRPGMPAISKPEFESLTADEVVNRDMPIKKSSRRPNSPAGEGS